MDKPRMVAFMKAINAGNITERRTPLAHPNLKFEFQPARAIEKLIDK